MRPVSPGEREALLLARSSLLRTSLALQTRLLVLRGRRAVQPRQIGAWLLTHPAAAVAVLLAVWQPRLALRLSLRLWSWLRPLG